MSKRRLVIYLVEWIAKLRRPALGDRRLISGGPPRSPPPTSLLFLFDAFDGVNPEVGILAADLLLNVASTAALPGLRGIHVCELEDANTIGQLCT